MWNLGLKLKQDKSTAQIVIKLLVNSMYGKTIIKPVDTDTIVKGNRDDFDKCISWNYSYIDSVIELFIINNFVYIKRVKSIWWHYNYVHCGVEILSMSKRIMNKVFSCADDCDIQVYCQDTDSIHLNYDDDPKIVDRYIDKYGLEVVGGDLVI